MLKTKLTAILLAFVFAFSGAGITTISAQKISDEARKASKEKVSKEAKKEAKQLQKEGWGVLPGAIPMERQIDRARALQEEVNEDYYPKYLTGEGKSIGEVYDAAKMQSTEIAKQDLVKKIQTELTIEIKSTLANQQISADEATTMFETIEASRSVISQSLGRVLTITDIYRTLENKQVEVFIRVAYDSDNIKKAAKQAIRNDMKKRGNEMHKKLEEIWK